MIQTTPLRPSYHVGGRGRIKAETGFRAFDDFVSSVMSGNHWGDGHFSSYIRPASQTACNGFSFPVGHLRETDLSHFEDLPVEVKRWVENVTSRRSVVLHSLYHLRRPYNYPRSVYQHGWIVSDPDTGGILAIFAARRAPRENRTKSIDVLVWAARVIMADHERALPDPVQL
jgi:hypothetical protein